MNEFKENGRKDLIEEYKELTEHYILLLQQKEDILYKNREYLECLCLYNLGESTKLKLRFSVDIKKINLKIWAIQNNIRKKDNIVLQNVYNNLDEKMNILEQEFKTFNKKLQYSYNFMQCEELEVNEQEEIVYIFKELARKFSPGMNDGKIKKIWKNIIKAYDLNDLNSLRLLSNTLKNDKNKDKYKYHNECILNKKILILKTEIDKLKIDIEKSKNHFPFNIEEELNNPKWIEKENKKIFKIVEKLSSQKNTQEEKLRYLELWYSMKELE